MNFLRLPRSTHSFILPCVGLSLLICFLTLVGWLLNLRFITRPYLHSGELKFNAAIAIGLCAIALVASNTRLWKVTFLFPVVALCYGLLSLVTHFFNTPSLIGTLLFQSYPADTLPIGDPGQIAGNTAASIVLLSASVLCLYLPLGRSRALWVHTLALCSFVLSICRLSFFFLNPFSGYHVILGFFACSMAASLSSFFLSLSILFSTFPNSAPSFMELINSPSTSSATVFRKLMLTMSFSVGALIWIAFVSTRLKILQTGVAEALALGGSVIILVTIIWRTAHTLSNSESQLRLAVKEVSEREQSLLYRAKFEKSLRQVSRILLASDWKEMEKSTKSCLELIAKTLGGDQTVIRLASGHERSGVISNFWIDPEFERVNKELLDRKCPEWAMLEIQAGRSVVVQDVNTLPNDDAEFFSAMGIKSGIGVPLFYNGEVVGLLAVDAIREKRAWDDETLFFLQTVSELFVNGLRRMVAEIALFERSDALQRSNSELEQFAYVSSHDLQEPLRMVGLYVKLIERKYSEKLDQEAQSYFQFIVEGTRRMQGLIRDILQYSRCGHRLEEHEKVDMNETLRAARFNLQTAIAQSNAEIQCDSLPQVLGSRWQIVQVFQNILSNSIKFRKPDTPLRITIQSQQVKDEWHIAISDNGIGIDPRFHQKIFQLFQRLSGPDSNSGTGIGLALVKKIISHHKGRIWLESTPGKGSTFYFTFPVSVLKRVENSSQSNPISAFN